MKRIAVLMLLIALFAVGATAVQISNPTIGDDDQDRVKNVAATFTVTNNNSVDMTGVSFSLAGGAESSKYALSFSGPSSIAVGKTETYTVNGTIPLNHDAVDSSLDEKALKIGTVTVTGTVGTATDSASSDIFMQAINQFRIKKARVDCGSKSETVDDGDKVENLKPGDSCTLEIEIENKFDNDDRNNQKIGDIEFTSIDINIDSSDSDVDIDEDSDVDDLGADDQDTITADIDIDEDANDGAIRIDVEIRARDENGALHGEALSFRLEVDRLTHDLQIRRLQLSPSTVTNCGASVAKLDVSLLNQGKRDEDEAAVEVTVDQFSFNERIDDIELDEDDSTAVSFSIPVPASAKEGVARVDVKTYFDVLALSNSGSVELVINKCDEDDDEPVVVPPPVNTGDRQSTVVVPQAPVTSSGGQAQAAPKRSSSFTDSQAYVALLVVLSVLIAIAIVALVVLLVRKKPTA